MPYPAPETPDARIAAERVPARGARREKRESGLVTLLLWALLLALAWGAISHPWLALLTAVILAPIGALFVIPILWFRRDRTSPERHAVLDLLSMLNPFA